MKVKGMDAVLSKSNRRKLGLKRRPEPGGIAILVGGAPPKSDEGEPTALKEESASAGTLTCPRCQAELADTEENRAYLDAQRIEDEGEAEAMAVEDDAALDEADDEEDY
jgi:hypothetical protein